MLSLGSIGLLAIGFGLGVSAATQHYPHAWPSRPFADVLDGDTVLYRGRAIRISDLDAPELGPWAHCWAEAALAGLARNQLESSLAEDRGWRLVEVKRNAAGRFSGRVLDREGFSIANDMSVYGGAARTTNRWNWCNPDATMHSPLDGEAAPHGPSLWWPTGAKFDQRAAD
jgi:endonuclease YncB( thermonuclease family)